MLRLLFTALAVTTALVTAASAQPCSGCGCRGGPGYRGPDGRCVGWADIGKTCGSPPTTRCKAEGPAAGADDAAAQGAAARAKRGAASR